ncbi:MAG: hypothetical protein HY332_17570 [Chloroflexi bacterium]|nr:hypothetical protein [Chloroflexota bacterium]
MTEHQGTSYGERLLRSDAVTRAADAVEADVREQLAAAMHGPVAAALAASIASTAAPVPGAVASGGKTTPSNRAADETAMLLKSEVPRRFIAAGAALAVAYAALAEGDEARTAGALLCAERMLFPHDPTGAAQVAAATRAALQRLDSPAPAAPVPGAGGVTPDSVEAVQRHVVAAAEQLGRVYLAAAPHVETAALGARSWLAATGGAGPASGIARAQFGPFVDGLVRWAFYVAAALESIRADDWTRAGAALMAARQEVQRGRGA